MSGIRRGKAAGASDVASSTVAAAADTAAVAAERPLKVAMLSDAHDTYRTAPSPASPSLPAHTHRPLILSNAMKSDSSPANPYFVFTNPNSLSTIRRNYKNP